MILLDHGHFAAGWLIYFSGMSRFIISYVKRMEAKPDITRTPRLVGGAFETVLPECFVYFAVLTVFTKVTSAVVTSLLTGRSALL